MAFNAGVVGASGYAGIELVRVLLNHPQFDLKIAVSDSLAGTPLAKAYPAFAGYTNLRFEPLDEAALSACDIVFLAVPHTASLALTPKLIDVGVNVIDLSADYRLKDPAVYEQWYGTPHTSAKLLAEAAFGLPELMGAELQEAHDRYAKGKPALVACAGCYPTATSLAAAPAVRNGLVDTSLPIVVDAISGVTGAGKKATERTHFCQANENIEAYNVGRHRHTPEIEQILGTPGRVVFTPHLAPLNRGLLSTVTLVASKQRSFPTTAELIELYREFYKASPFVQVLPENVLPKTSSVAGSNQAHIGVVAHEPTGTLIALGAIDNLGKGAADQAVQCANIVFGLPETSGLTTVTTPI